jgi:hypothetical protein
MTHTGRLLLEKQNTDIKIYSCCNLIDLFISQKEYYKKNLYHIFHLSKQSTITESKFMV